MFKKTKSVLVLALIAAMCVSLTACQGKNNQSSVASQSSVISASSTAEKTESSSSSKAESQEVSSDSKSESSSASSKSESSTDSSKTSETSEKQSSSSQTGTYKSVKDFVKSDAVQDQVAAYKKSNSSAMNVSVKADDDHTLVYEYKFTSQIKVTSSMKTQLKKTLSTNKATFENIVDAVDMAVDCKDPIVVIVRYINADGSTIYEEKYTK